MVIYQDVPYKDHKAKQMHLFNSDEYSAIAGILNLEKGLWNNINLNAAKSVFIHNHQAKFPLPVGWIQHGTEFFVKNGYLYKQNYEL